MIKVNQIITDNDCYLLQISCFINLFFKFLNELEKMEIKLCDSSQSQKRYNNYELYVAK